MTASTISRNSYFDFLRGLAICMVVAIHTAPQLSFDSGVIGTIQIVLRQIMNAGVPIFLAISGYFLAKKPLESWLQRREFWKKQIAKIYIPMLLWSLPLFAVSIWSASLQNLPQNILNLLFGGFSIYYFVALIIQYYLLLPWLQPFRIKTLIMAICISVLSILCVTYGAKLLVVSLPLLLLAGPFPVWIVFFVLGGVIRCNPIKYSLFASVIIIILALIAQFFEAQHLNILGSGGGFGIKLSSFIFSFGLILLLFSEKLERKYNSSLWLNKWIEKLGNLSFGIYLIHCYVIIVVERIIPSNYWLLDFLLVLTLTSLIILISKKLLPTVSKRYLGFL